MNTAAIILAAGFSSRMGTDKALLDLGGKPVIKRIVSSYQAVGIERILVVTGQNHAALRQLQLQAVLLKNPVPENGMFSSIQAGVALLEPEVDAFFVHPVDTPLVSPETLASLICALQHNPAVDGVIPAYCGRRGHPPLLRSSMKEAAAQYQGGEGLRGLLSVCRTTLHPVADQGVLLGMNTPEQYEDLQQYLVLQ